MSLLRLATVTDCQAARTTVSTMLFMFVNCRWMKSLRECSFGCFLNVQLCDPCLTELEGWLAVKVSLLPDMAPPFRSPHCLRRLCLRTLRLGGMERQRRRCTQRLLQPMCTSSSPACRTGTTHRCERLACVWAAFAACHGPWRAADVCCHDCCALCCGRASEELLLTVSTLPLMMS